MQENKAQNGFGIIGALVVGAAAGALAMFLGNRDNRDKVQKTMDQLKERGKRALENTETKTQELKKEVEREAKKTRQN